MACGTFSIDIPALYSGPRPKGGLRFRATGTSRAFTAILPSIPGRMVHTGIEGGKFACKGWAWIEDADDARNKLFDILIWIARAEHRVECHDLDDLERGEDDL